MLITLDTTRADALGCLGGKAAWTPQLDALARESVLYIEARTVAPLTMPAHASMLTGLYPPRHGVRDNNLVPLPSAAETVAELARARGIRTAAFVSSVSLDRAFGFAQGFGTWEQPGPPTRPVAGQDGTRAGSDTAARAIAWLRDVPADQPFFLWVHFFDAHKPYRPSPELLARAGDPYHGEVATEDAAVGELLRALRERGALDHTLVVVAGDHGEGLGEHGEETHGALCFDSTIRVPLLVRRPDGVGAGERSSAVVSVVDVYPTLLHGLGLEAPAGADGLDLCGTPLPADRGVYFESFFGFLSYGWSPLSGWADRQGVYLHESAPLIAAPGADPHAPRPEEQERVARCVQEIGAVAARPALPPDASADEALVDSLRGLGYAAASAPADDLPSPLAVAGRPSPHEHVAEHERTMYATNLYILGHPGEAVPIFQELLAKDPESVLALEGLGTSLSLEGRWREAVDPWRRLVATGARGARAPYDLAVALFHTDHPEEAERWLRVALTADPDHVKALEQLLRLVQARGDGSEAADLRKRLDAARAAHAGAAGR